MSKHHPYVPARPAATLILLRDGAEGIEVFMLRRGDTAGFAAGAYVFPGGRVDEADGAEVWAERCHGLVDDTGRRHPGAHDDGMPYLVAAIRECFEEAGLLLASEEGAHQHGLLALHDPSLGEVYARLRAELIEGALNFDALCRQRRLRLATDRMAYLSRWITPVGQPKRFDTRFFITAVPPHQTGTHDNVETTEHLWVKPADALARFERGEIDLFFPTRSSLKYLLRFADAESAIRQAHRQDSVPLYEPRRAIMRKAGFDVFREGDPQYAEIRKIDPHQELKAWGEIVPGMVTTLSPTVQRVTAGNPGMMTGPGTNTYLLGGNKTVAVIDPGPLLDEHVQAILAALAGRRVDAILVTHTHQDHSPASVPLAAALQASQGTRPLIIGMPAPPNQDPNFAPDHVPVHGEKLMVGGCSLRVFHTPGHASNHLCYLHEAESLMFTGDHIMQGSTVVINPPDGDMVAYIASLRDLERCAEAERFAWLAPAHGFLIDQPVRAMRRLIAHRLAREAKVIEALEAFPGGRIAELMTVAYDDVPVARNMVASRSLLAHLNKLKQEGRAVETDAGWIRVEGR